MAQVVVTAKPGNAFFRAAERGFEHNETPPPMQ